MYIIKDGEFEFTKKNNEIKDLSMGLFRCTSPVVGVNPLSNKMETRDLRLKVMGKGNIFGEIEAAHGKNYETTVRCSSTTGILLCISTSDFVTVINQTNKSTLNCIKNTDETIIDNLDNFKNNERKMQVTSRLQMMNYEEEKIELLAQTILDKPLYDKNCKKSSMINDNPFFKNNGPNVKRSRLSSRLDENAPSTTVKRVPYSK